MAILTRYLVPSGDFNTIPLAESVSSTSLPPTIIWSDAVVDVPYPSATDDEWPAVAVDPMAVALAAPATALYPIVVMSSSWVAVFCPASVPRTVCLDAVVVAYAELLRGNEAARYPAAVLLVPVVFAANAWYPAAVLLPPVVFAANAWYPAAVLLPPVVFDCNACRPAAVLLAPVVFDCNAWYPAAVLLLEAASDRSSVPAATTPVRCETSTTWQSVTFKEPREVNVTDTVMEPVDGATKPNLPDGEWKA
ncbi:MAG: hypothetical protein ACSLE6_07365 [Mycobacterium sp.]